MDRSTEIERMKHGVGVALWLKLIMHRSNEKSNKKKNNSSNS